jgi:hypothetical protein
MTSRTCQLHDAQGCFCPSTNASTSTNLPGRFPDTQAVPPITDPHSDNEVQGLLTETGPPNIGFLRESKPSTPSQEPEPCLHSLLGPTIGLVPLLHQSPPDLSFASRSMPLPPAQSPASPVPPAQFASAECSTSRSTSILYLSTHPPTARFPTAWFPSIHYAPPLMMPPAPAGINPIMWANNQALILSLLALPAFQQSAPAPALPQPKEGDVRSPNNLQ